MTTQMKACRTFSHAGLPANEADHVFKKSLTKDEDSLKPIKPATQLYIEMDHCNQLIEP